MRIVALVGLAVALTGCGSASGPSLEDAAEATSAETSRFEMHVRYLGPAMKSLGEMKASGAFDYPNERAAITVSGEFPFLGDEVDMKEVRLIGRTTYMRWIVKDQEYWIKDVADETVSDPNELLIPFPGSPTKPTDVLERVVAAGDEIEVLGTEDLRGVKTTHYRARVDVKKLSSGQEGQEEVLDIWGGRFVPVELWIDDDSRLRRITITRASNEDGETTSVELFDYGVSVDVEPVAAEELTSQEEFDKLIDPYFQLVPGESTEAKEQE